MVINTGKTASSDSMTSSSSNNQDLPLENLSDRHSGLTAAVAAACQEAASICLSRHHQSPKAFVLSDDGQESIVRIQWQSPNEATQAAWANEIDATEAGACACAIAALEHSRNLYAIRRAETLTGADYYIAPLGNDLEDLENCYRLEISGTRLAKVEVRKRLRSKVLQAQRGQSNLPAIAAVIGFAAALILIQTVEEES